MSVMELKHVLRGSETSLSSPAGTVGLNLKIRSCMGAGPWPSFLDQIFKNKKPEKILFAPNQRVKVNVYVKRDYIRGI